MKSSEVNKKMDELKNAGLLDNFTKRQIKCLRELIKHQQEFVIIGNERKETERLLFEAKKTPL